MRCGWKLGVGHEEIGGWALIGMLIICGGSVGGQVDFWIGRAAMSGPS